MLNRPTLTIVTSDTRAAFQNQVIRGFQEVTEPAGHAIRVVDVTTSPRGRAFDSESQGFLVIGQAVPDKALIHLYARGVPISLISHQVPPYPIPSVMFNNAQGMGMLVRHLVEGCERRRLVYMGGLPRQFDEVQREMSFRDELRRYQLDLPDRYVLRGNLSPDIAIQAMASFISARHPFDGIVAADYVIAQAAAATVRGMGYLVPSDVSVVGFGDAPDAERAGITTVAADVSELGRRAARQLLNQIDGLKIRGVTTLSLEMVVRESCGYYYVGAGS